MMDPIAVVILMFLVFVAGHFHGYAKAMRYCTKKLEELRS